MAKGQKYAAEIVEKALGLMAVRSLASVSRELKIPKTTLLNWRDGKTNYVKASSPNIEQLRTDFHANVITHAREQVNVLLSITGKRLERALKRESEIDELMDTVNSFCSGDVELKDKMKRAVSTLSKIRVDDVGKLALLLNTLYDKQALASGDATQNVKGELNIEALLKRVEGKSDY